jgi:hypothetical protein
LPPVAVLLEAAGIMAGQVEPAPEHGGNDLHGCDDVIDAPRAPAPAPKRSKSVP